MAQSLRILIVDDMPAVRLILRNMLEEAGHGNVIEAEDGDVAWELIRSTIEGSEPPIDLVIADWNMPRMSGVDLLRAVRSSPHTRDVHFLIVTAQGDPAHVSEALDAGATDYVVKPFDSPTLGRKIREITGI